MSRNDLKHYYVDDQKELTNRKEITFRFLDIEFRFTSADNVFSKDKVDLGSILLLQHAIESGISGNVLDYGCGYGVVGIVLAKLDHSVMAVDVTHRAVELSKLNAINNHVDLKVELIENNNVTKYKSLFNTVLLNPPIRAGKETIYSMFDNAYNFLDSEGVFYIVIRKQHGAASAIKKLETLFDSVTVLKKAKGYWIIKSVKVWHLDL